MGFVRNWYHALKVPGKRTFKHSKIHKDLRQSFFYPIPVINITHPNLIYFTSGWDIWICRWQITVKSHYINMYPQWCPLNQFLVTEVLPMLFWNLWLPPLNQQFLKIWQNAQIHLRQTLVIEVTQHKAQKTIRWSSNQAVCSGHLHLRRALDV